jgi:hypothetical protein
MAAVDDAMRPQASRWPPDHLRPSHRRSPVPADPTSPRSGSVRRCGGILAAMRVEWRLAPLHHDMRLCSIYCPIASGEERGCLLRMIGNVSSA